MSSQTYLPAQSTQSNASSYSPGSYAKLNALQRDHSILKKRYNAAVVHNDELKSSLDTIKTNFKQLSAAYTAMTESDSVHLVEIETLKQERDVLKRQNATLEVRETRRNSKRARR